MRHAHFRFYAELNDFLPLSCRQVTFEHTFEGRVSVKDMIEALGVPHTEVDLILVKGAPVAFSYLVRDGDRVSVYPVFEALDIGPLTRLRPEPLREPRFVLDTHLVMTTEAMGLSNDLARSIRRVERLASVEGGALQDRRFDPRLSTTVFPLHRS